MIHTWSETIFGVPQGSILGPLLFNIFICDMFYFMEDFEIANYADDSTNLFNNSINQLLKNYWRNCWRNFIFNFIYMASEQLYEDQNWKESSSAIWQLTANIDVNVTESEDNQIVLSITTDSNLSFNKHINNLCKKASTKLNAFARISGYMDLPKHWVIKKSFITSQCGYCPLIWMFHSRALNNKINSIHERALRITYNDSKSTFEELLNKDNSVSIHHRNLQVLAIEMFKIKNNMAPEFLNEIFQNRALLYNLRTNSNFSSRQVHSVYHGTNRYHFLDQRYGN